MSHRFARVVLPFAALLACSTARADLRAFAGVGYDSLTLDAATDGEDDRSFGGLTFQALGQFDVVEPLPGLGVFVGGGLGIQGLTYQKDGGEVEWNAKMLKTEAGVNFGLVPLLTLQAALGYDHALSGEIAVKKPAEVNLDLDSYSRIRMSGRAFLSPLPLVRVGAEVSVYPSGSAKVDVTGAKEQDVSGWGASLVAGVSL